MIGCPEKSVNKYQSTLSNVPEERRSCLCRGKKPVITHGLETSGQGKSTMVGTCEHCNVSPGFANGSDFLTR